MSQVCSHPASLYVTEQCQSPLRYDIVDVWKAGSVSDIRIVRTVVSMSPISIIRYLSVGGDALQLGR